MRKIKKFLGLVLAVTICVLGLASCGESNSTVEIETQSKDKGVLTIENVKGELYAQTYNFETTKGVFCYRKNQGYQLQKISFYPSSPTWYSPYTIFPSFLHKH